MNIRVKVLSKRPITVDVGDDLLNINQIDLLLEKLIKKLELDELSYPEYYVLSSNKEGEYSIDIESSDNKENKKAKKTLRVFLSYSKSDKVYKDKLDKHLIGLKKSNRIESWEDSLIDPGEEWNNSIINALKDSDIILLLISVDFLNTEYIQNIEVKNAMKKHKKGDAKVIPIILRPCDWEDFDFAKLNALPPKGVPVSEYQDEDIAFLQIIKGLKIVIEKFKYNA